MRSVRLSAASKPCANRVAFVIARAKKKNEKRKTKNTKRAILPMPVKDTFVSDDDYLILEDEFGRVPLVAADDAKPLPTHELVTGEERVVVCFYTLKINIAVRASAGVVVALYGEEIDGGDFRVLDIIEPGLAPQAPLPVSLSLSSSSSSSLASTLSSSRKLVALLSGLELGDGDAMKTELLCDFLLNNANISRCIVVGNAVASPPPPPAHTAVQPTYENN